jgi:hypothetical protein
VDQPRPQPQPRPGLTTIATAFQIAPPARMASISLGA